MPAGEAALGAAGRRQALQRAAAALGVSSDANLRQALLTAAAEEVERSPAFAERVRALLARDEATPAPPLAASRRTRLVPLTQIGDATLDPFAPPDPHYLHRLYGAEQLPAALGEYSYASLRAAAQRLFGVSDRGASTSLPRGKAALIAAIVDRVIVERS